MMNTPADYQETIENLINRAYDVFEQHHPGWGDYLFDETFLTRHTTPMFDNLRALHPDDLVSAWAQQIRWQDDTIREQRIAELLPAATQFLLILDSVLRQHYH